MTEVLESHRLIGESFYQLRTAYEDLHVELSIDFSQHEAAARLQSRIIEIQKHLNRLQNAITPSARVWMDLSEHPPNK